MILSVDFETEEEIDDTNNDKIELKCPCEGRCLVLRN